MPKLRVHLVDPPEDAEMTRLQELTPDVDWTQNVAEAEVIVGGSPDLVDAATNLRHFVLPWAGVSDRLLETIRGREGVTLHNLHDNAPATAEHAIALLLAACRWLPGMDLKMRQGHWPGRNGPSDAVERMIVLQNKSAVLLGYGEIGRRVGRVLEAMDVTICPITRNGRNGTKPVDQIDDVLPQAELLVCSLPATPATRELLDQRRLDLLPNGAVVVNVGRGGVFKEKALFSSVRSRRIAMAGLDVWWTYPHQDPDTRGGEMPWHELDNVVMTPHVAAAPSSPDRKRRRAEALAELLLALARGELPSRVDLDAGY
jgi:phosphoglycerate dehydrogenase-like enzyme